MRAGGQGYDQHSEGRGWESRLDVAGARRRVRHRQQAQVGQRAAGAGRQPHVPLLVRQAGAYQPRQVARAAGGRLAKGARALRAEHVTRVTRVTAAVRVVAP